MKLSDQGLVSGSKEAISYTSEPNANSVVEVATFLVMASPCGAERPKSDAAESMFAQDLRLLPRPRGVESHANTCQGDVECRQHALIQVAVQAFSAPVAMCAEVGTQ